MASSATNNAKPAPRKAAAQKPAPKPSSAAKSANGTSAAKRKTAPRAKAQSVVFPEVPVWVGIAASVVGVGLAAGFFAWRHYLNDGSWSDGFNAAFADGETDVENFDQTRNAGAASMRTDQGDDWEDIDEMADASFPASDPPSFNPGTS
jgi:hypothetical protein